MPRRSSNLLTQDEALWLFAYLKRKFRKTPATELLDEELEFYRFLFLMFKSDKELNSLSKAIEFCTDKEVKRRDNIYGRYFDDLTDQQYGFLENISNHVRDWLRQQVTDRSPARRRRIRS